MNIDFGEMAEKIFDNCKKITPALIAVALTTGGILFLPQNILTTLGLTNLSGAVRTTIGIIFLISTVLIFTIIVWSYWEKIYTRVKNRRLKKQLKAKFKKLPPELKDILIQIMEKPEHAMTLNSLSSSTIYLVQNLYIYQPRQMVDPDSFRHMSLKYVAEPWLTELYYDDPELFRR